MVQEFSNDDLKYLSLYLELQNRIKWDGTRNSSNNEYDMKYFLILLNSLFKIRDDLCMTQLMGD